MKVVQKLLLLVLSVSVSGQAVAQCGTFADSPKESEATEAHVLYRDQVKAKNFDGAYDSWRTAYTLAPAADGERASHYSDGRDILKHKLTTADDATKPTLITEIIKLYDEQITCYGEEGEKARLIGMKAFDMFYSFRTPYSKLLETLKSAVTEGGDNTGYVVFVPYATVVEYQFTNEKMEKEEARQAYETLNKIADANINGDGPYKEQYSQAKESMNAIFRRIEDYIFDCDYFKVKLIPEYKADKDNPDVIKRVYNKLVSKGCDKEDPILQELKGKYESYAANENAKRQQEFNENNPAFMAKKAYDAGDYKGAISKYEDALAAETDPEKQADIYFRMASIHGRKLKSFSKGRALALKAAGLKGGWGQPYMLIGDLYALGSRNCGNAFMQRCAILAATDKYSYAKSIDPNVAQQANDRISKYRDSRPDKETAFMMGHKAGAKIKVSCWIGETVTLKF